jgi:hypothetical protein
MNHSEPIRGYAMSTEAFTVRTDTVTAQRLDTLPLAWIAPAITWSISYQGLFGGACLANRKTLKGSEPLTVVKSLTTTRSWRRWIP